MSTSHSSLGRIYFMLWRHYFTCTFCFFLFGEQKQYLNDIEKIKIRGESECIENQIVLHALKCSLHTYSMKLDKTYLSLHNVKSNFDRKGISNSDTSI